MIRQRRSQNHPRHDRHEHGSCFSLSRQILPQLSLARRGRIELLGSANASPRGCCPSTRRNSDELQCNPLLRRASPSLSSTRLAACGGGVRSCFPVVKCGSRLLERPTSRELSSCQQGPTLLCRTGLHVILQRVLERLHARYNQRQQGGPHGYSHELVFFKKKEGKEGRKKRKKKKRKVSKCSCLRSWRYRPVVVYRPFRPDKVCHYVLNAVPFPGIVAILVPHYLNLKFAEGADDEPNCYWALERDPRCPDIEYFQGLELG